MQGSPVKNNAAPQQGYPPQQGGSPVRNNAAPQQGGYPPPQQGGYPPQQGGYPPQQGGYPPQSYQQTPYVQAAKIPSGFDRLANRDGIYIKQKIDIAEVSSGCERANSYFVYGVNKAIEKTGVELFRARETSDFCVRQLLSGHCRPFTLNILLRDVDEKVHNQPFLQLQRPCACTFYCIGRPVVNVTLVEAGKSTFIGKIVDPFIFLDCDAKLDVYNASNNVVYKIRGKCCQRGLMCNMPCQSCQTADFAVNSTMGQQVATLQKRTAGFFASAYTEADNFALTFPVNATPEDKALLMAATLFLDYRHFEEKKGIF